MYKGIDIRLARWLRLIARVEDGILAAMLAVMIVIASLQIILRNFFDSGYISGDPMLRVLVLWVGLLGAIVASREDKHISIDIFTRIFTARTRLIIRACVDLFVALVCGLAAYHAARFVAMDYEAGTRAFVNAPAWLIELILPVAFGVIAVRYALFSVINVQRFRDYEDIS